MTAIDESSPSLRALLKNQYSELVLRYRSGEKRYKGETYMYRTRIGFFVADINMLVKKSRSILLH